VQYNSSGAFAGASAITTNGTSLTIGGPFASDAQLTINANTLALPAVSAIGQTLLHLGGADGVIPNIVIDTFSNVAVNFAVRHAAGSLAARTPTVSTTLMSIIAAYGYIGANQYASGAPQVQFWTAENYGSATQGNYIQFNTVAVGTNTNKESARVQPSGGFSVGANNGTPDPGAGNIRATGLTLSGITGSVQCLHASTAGLVGGTGADCGTGTGTPLSVVARRVQNNQTYTPTPGMVTVRFDCTGGGGAGGGVVGAVGSARAGGGGGAGSQSSVFLTAAQVTADGGSEVITIGGGGSGVSGAAGSAGGDTSVGTRCVGKGGFGGNFNNQVGAFGEYGGGGVPGTGDFVATGNNGGTGGAFSVTTQVVLSGYGGNSPSCGSGAAPTPALAGSNNNGGNAAAGSGGGGGGASGNNVAANLFGGSGGSGCVFITEYLGTGGGGGGGAVASVSNADGTLTISPTTGAVVASLNLAHSNTWTAPQQINVASASAINITGSAPGANEGTTITNTSSTGNAAILLNNDLGLAGSLYATGSTAASANSLNLTNFTAGGLLVLGANNGRVFLYPSGGLAIGGGADPGANNLRISGINGGTRCLHVDTTGLVSGTASDCGTSGGGITGISSPNGTITTGGTTAATVDLNLAHANVWTAAQDLTISQNGGTFTTVTNANSGTSAAAGFIATNGTNAFSFAQSGAGYTAVPILGPARGYLYVGSTPLAIVTGGAQPIIFGVAQTEVARFTGTGLGIQPTGQGVAPDAPLTINANTAVSSIQGAGINLHIIGANGTVTYIQHDAFGSTPYYITHRANGTLAAKTAAVAGDNLAGWQINGWDGSAYYPPAQISATALETFSPTTHGTAIDVVTTAIGATTAVQNFRFQGSGGLSVGNANVTADAGNGIIAAAGLLLKPALTGTGSQYNDVPIQLLKSDVSVSRWFYLQFKEGAQNYGAFGMDAASTDANPVFFIGRYPSNVFTYSLTIANNIITAAGHLVFTGSLPSIISCGAAGSVVAGSVDAAGSGIMGAGGPTSCQINFATSYARPPNCTATNNTRVAATSIAASASGFVVAGLVSGDAFTWNCFGS
jgi:hypothetical protein